MVRVEDDAEIPESGAVFTFGKSKFADNVPSKFWIRNDVIKTVACGDEHSVALTGNGRIYVFGSNEWGQLGLSNKKTVTKPYCLKALKHEKVISAAGGRAHTLLTTESGKMFTFGGNSEGQLGVGDTDSRSEPCLVTGLDGHVVAVAAGSYHSVLLTADGEVYVFGSNSEGQLGLGDVQKVSSPTKLELGVQIDVVSCGYYHTALVSKDGKVYTFGEKDAGKLGLLEKQLTDGANRKPQCIFSITERVIGASCGGNHTALVTECGKLYTFGSGLNGQLGLGTMIMETASPSLVGALDNEKIIHVGCGESHTAIVTEQGKIYTCGDGRHGKLGLGDENFSNQFNPVLVKKFNGYFVHQVACGGCHMLVVASKQATDVNEAEPDEPDVTEANANTIRGRRRLNDLQGNQTSAVTQTYGRPLPPLGTNLNDTEPDKVIPNKEELKTESERLDQLEPSTADTLNGNYTEVTANPIVEPEQSPIIENSAELRVSTVDTSPPSPTQQPVIKSSVESLKAEPVVEWTPAPAAVLVTPQPITNKDVDDDGESEESSGESGHSSSDEDDNENKSNKIECKAVIESEPPQTPPQMSIITKIVTKESQEQSEPVKDHTKDEVPEETKPVRKKFWTFGRKKSRSDESEALNATANDEVKTVKETSTVESVATLAEKKPSKSATSIFSRSVGNSDAQPTTNKKQTGSTNKSSTCVIL